MKAISQKCPLRQWGVYRKVHDAVRSGTFGELCSVRWIWLSRSNDDCIRLLTGLLDVSQELVGGKLKRLHIESANNVPMCFALADFEGGIVMEFEINAALPSFAPDTHFLIADFTGGRVTNRPLTGFHHDEGAFIATDAGAKAFLFEPVPVVSGSPQNVEITEIITLALKEATR